LAHQLYPSRVETDARITPVQVVRCLRAGKLVDGPTRDEFGKWICKLERLSAGDAVAVAIDPSSDLIVITVFEAD
jgi:hypothetical protein